jgi:8-oxo-dGTP pyrophosphatase MutT (NUDIX family)
MAWHARNAWLRFTTPLTMGVRVIVQDDTGCVLLIRHSYIKGWHLPGGGVGRHETLATAARREAREEAGVEVECPAQPFGVYARFRHGASDHVALFVASAWRGTPRPDAFEIIDLDFFPLDALPPDTSPATRRRLDEFRGLSPVAESW